MSLLHQDTPDQIDDAARGEEFTKGSSNLVYAGLLAAVIVTAFITFYVIANRKEPVATGDIEQVWVHSQHTETSGFDANGAPMPKESMDQIYVFAQVKIHNQSAQPLFLRNALVNAKFPDGIHSSYAATAGDYDRVFVAYKDMPVPHLNPLSLQSTVAPGQTVEGEVVAAFRMDKQQWDAHQDLNFTIGMQYQPSLTLAPHAPIIDR
jgi:hypothetical protein